MPRTAMLKAGKAKFDAWQARVGKAKERLGGKLPPIATATATATGAATGGKAAKAEAKAGAKAGAKKVVKVISAIDGELAMLRYEMYAGYPLERGKSFIWPQGDDASELAEVVAKFLPRELPKEEREAHSVMIAHHLHAKSALREAACWDGCEIGAGTFVLVAQA